MIDMFPAGIFFLFLAVLDPHDGATHWQILENHAGMNWYQCDNFRMYFKEHPYRLMDEGGVKVITSAECIREQRD